MKRTAFITGGTQGIGKAIVEKLISEDYEVIIGFMSQRAKANDMVKHIHGMNGDAIAVHCDISRRSSIQAVLAKIKHIDILINNAGISQSKDFLDITDEDWNQMLNINLRGAFICSQEVIPSMLERNWGRIINITSIGGQWGGINQVHYASSKAGLTGLTMSLARLYSGKGITSNSVSPGIIETDMTAWIKDKDKKILTQDIPVGRFGLAEEVAETVSFLASEASGYITGQTINVNGGMLRT
ncbi:3-oxoacyl-ACP reductase FabG [Gammaproteobacteria bacterium]|nr:3-oxoacyl-ACP reductase FabG [Gammaproteobacteria bacterium]